MISRRALLEWVLSGAAGLLALVALPRPGRAAGALLPHPEPREGITGEEVVSAAQLRTEGHPDEVIELFDGIRAMPEVADGLACYCGCALMGNRSLLTCYSPTGMARGCAICQGEARIAIGRHAEGQSLEQIRGAIDARYGADPA